MRMKNETYDILSWISSPLIPALVALILTLGKTWEIPYYIQIGASISAVGVFLEALLRKSSKKYYQELDEIAVGEAIEEDRDQGEIPLDEEQEAEDEPFEP